MTQDPGQRSGSPLRIVYVLGTTAGGTGPHVAMLTELATVTLRINAAETFDGLAAAAASGAARIFAVPAVLILQMPDGQDRRVSAIPGSIPMRDARPV